ncbi:hypothetical protein G7077_04110 [Sphingomonas piscis]|uniref:Uncharacterized protein n=1 Tax=Sphingomonas piscis TaxID=2714943 RepID=A0A6G7YNA0_9SPHN|nr:hypothetical protein [Sphingomonas piscis]QIK78207.1 hypothetical protein G7077_04110 [Sphingomonas piscis]
MCPAFFVPIAPAMGAATPVAMIMFLVAAVAILAPGADDATLMKNDDQAVQRGFTQVRRTIPAGFQGDFRNSLEECALTTPVSLRVAATRLSLPEADADVLTVRVEAPRKLVVSSIYESSTEIWERTETLLLSRDGKRLAIVSPTGSSTRVRCPAK